MSKHVVPLIEKAGGGAIVNLGSISSFIAQPNFVTYNTTKAAVSNMTRCMVLDLGPKNIRVNAVCPGTVWTRVVEERNLAAGRDRAAADKDPGWGGAAILKRIAEPRNRLRHPLSLNRRGLVCHRREYDGGWGVHNDVIEEKEKFTAEDAEKRKKRWRRFKIKTRYV